MIKNPPAAFRFAVLACLLAIPDRTWAQPASPAPGDTRIAQWKDDKKAAFMMMFDDCCPSHVTNVYPELQKRKMTGTFYVVPNKPERLARAAFWEKEAPASPYVVYGNHTLNHRAFTDAANAEEEIVGCNEFILRLMPGKNPRLISYATPGGAKHATTSDEIKAIAAKHNLVIRPPFQGHGGGIHFKTGADILKAVDKAVAAGSSEYVIFHGVGGDWLSFDGAQFVALLDGLETRRSEVWITDPISQYKYETGRDAARTRVLKTGSKEIRLALDCSVDPALYDQPLTLVTRVDAAWKRCRVTQGKETSVMPVQAAEVRYEALPGTEIVLTAAD
ncbi:MAG: polysaccharide deacetylase family protein [Opitutaceae bacterium]|jgi:peptidoglycan/xylan/chitin deacetylase (PgdA/CDA1 family)